jgi:hypothetical protein
MSAIEQNFNPNPDDIKRREHLGRLQNVVVVVVVVVMAVMLRRLPPSTFRRSDRSVQRT